MDPNQPLAVVLPPSSGSTLFPGTVGQAFGINFFLSGGAAPYSWAVTAGQLPAGMQLQTFSDPRDANDEMAAIIRSTALPRGLRPAAMTAAVTKRPGPGSGRNRPRFDIMVSEHD